MASGSANARIADMDGTGPRFRLQLIGRFAVWRDGEPVLDRDVGSRQGRTLLKVLVLHAHEPVSVDRLCGALWGETPPDSAERNIASLVSRLRRLLGPDTIEGGPGAYRIRVGPGLHVDVLEVERLAEEARQRLGAGEPALAAAAVERALDLIGSATLLAGEPDQDWLAAARHHLTSLRQQLRHRGAEAALALQDPDQAVRLAEPALSDDPLDEAAARALMQAHHTAGRTAEALRVHARLRVALADELGVDPSPPTRELHTALLREAEPSARPSSVATGIPVGATPSRHAGTGFVGRDSELASLLHRWSTAIQGHAGIVLISGEAGIGKTRLAQELAAVVEGTGGLVLGARCYEAERSLFLGPVVEVAGALAARTPPDRLARVVDRWGGVLGELVPEIADVLGPLPHKPTSPEIERRRIFDAIAALLQRASQDRPLVVLLDDLHNAGASTVELLHHLARRVTSGRLLIVATCRVEEGDHVLHELANVTDRIDLGALSAAAVTALVRAAGAERFGSQVLAATRGHTLSVVETLHALGDGDDGPDILPVPASLAVAVEQRIARAGAAVEELVRGAATLGATFELATVADLLELPMEEIVRRSERAVRARLLVEEGTRYAFSNDLIQQIVYDTTPRPVRVARHRRAAAILAGNPEVVAWHANAAEDWATAWPAWVEAADHAARRYANRDAEQLLARALSAAEAADDVAGVARVRLIRARVREALADFRGELDDLDAARELARRHGHPDLEAAALRQLGGDVQVGLGRPTTDCLPYLEAGLDVARSAQLGRIEVELQGRIAVIWSNRTRFDRAFEAAEAALTRARELDDDGALALALDAVKNVSAYMGDLDRLETVVPELERLLTGQDDLSLLQYLPWVVFESAIGPLARADWDRALTRLDEAITLSRQTGHPWRSLFLAHRSWVHRQRGAYGAALADARLAADDDVSAGHPWWSAFADVMLGWVLSDLGQDVEAVQVLEAGATRTGQDGMESYLLRCVSHLALARWRAGDRAGAGRDLARVEELLDEVTAPEGRAFLHGAHVYGAVARLHLARGDTGAARRLLDVVLGPAERVGWCEVVVTDRVLRARVHAMEGNPDRATPLLKEAVTLAETAGLRPLAWEAHVILAQLTVGKTAHPSHEESATAHLDAMAGALEDEGLRSGLRRAAARHAKESLGRRPS